MVELKWEPSIDAAEIGVGVKDGVVTLRDWGYQREAAHDAVRHLMGVRAVSNDITVKSKAKPVEVKAKIESALQRNALLDARRIKVATRGSKVILSGSVHSWAERQEAQRAA